MKYKKPTAVLEPETTDTSSRKLSTDVIAEMTSLMDEVIGGYSSRDALLQRYEEIYFMTLQERPKGIKVDEGDIKLTVSASGRNSVTQLKRILDTSEIQIKVRAAGQEVSKSDKIEAGLKTILRVSGEYRIARIEKDSNLSASLYGPAVLLVESVQDLVDIKSKGDPYINEFVKKQLELIQLKTPFLLRAINAKQSYPEWGSYGMIGHVWKYTVKGSELKERWGVDILPGDYKRDYTVKDYFHYCNRLVLAEGIKEPLFAGEWVTRAEDGEIIGSINVPVFARYSGGTSLFHESDKQLQPLLYAMAKGEWDKRQNLYWTVLFTSMFMQGLPGPIIMVDPEMADQDVKVKFDKGVRIIVGKGHLEKWQVIDGDMIQLKRLMDTEDANSTMPPQSQNRDGMTFSQFAMESRSGLIPAQDPKEALEQVYKDAFTHILQRIKEEDIPNDLIQAQDIPDKFELIVTLEPDLAQDDLRNAQIVTNLKNSGANVSDEWLNSTLLKISDSAAMWKQKTKEQLRTAIVNNIIQNPQLMQPMIMRALGIKPPAGGAPTMGDETPTDFDPAFQQEGGQMAEGEALPQTDAMVPPGERM